MPVDPRFVTAYSKSTGRKQRIPRHWLDNPRLGADFEAAPLQQRAERLAGPPDGKWKVRELEAYAAEHDVDLEGASKKVDILAAIDAAATDPSANPAGAETPANGDDEGAQ